jgi:uncharacterized protein (TIGR00369 family)
MLDMPELDIVSPDTFRPEDAGFELLRRGGPYFQQLGPIWWRPTASGGRMLLLRIAGHHINMQGVAHGGMLTTLADGALGINISLARGKRGGQVTVSLTADFLSSARLGDWLEAHATVTRCGRTLAYANCELKVGARQVLRSSAVFAFVDRPLPELAPAQAAEPPISDG